MRTPLYGPAAQEAAPALDPASAASCPPRPADYYDDYDKPPPLTRPDRALPARPDNATPEQLREWADRCSLIRSMFGSGN